MRLLEWDLIQPAWSLPKEREGHQECVHAEKRPRDGTARRRPSASPGEMSQKNPTTEILILNFQPPVLWRNFYFWSKKRWLFFLMSTLINWYRHQGNRNKSTWLNRYWVKEEGNLKGFWFAWRVNRDAFPQVVKPEIVVDDPFRLANGGRGARGISGTRCPSQH